MLETLYKEALDRKKNPKEGSYTNYLFDKGLDKILILSYSSRKLCCPVSAVNSYPTTRQLIRDVLPINCYSYQNLHFLCD